MRGKPSLPDSPLHLDRQYLAPKLVGGKALEPAPVNLLPFEDDSGYAYERIPHVL